MQREGRLGLRPRSRRDRGPPGRDRGPLRAPADAVDWFYERYACELPGERVIRYEDIIATGGAALAPIASSAAGLGLGLESRNAAAVYEREHMRDLGRLLLERDGAQWLFYTREEVSQLMTAAGV